jgi:hypothetical protein
MFIDLRFQRLNHELDFKPTARSPQPHSSAPSVELYFEPHQMVAAATCLPWGQLVCTRYQLVASSDPSSLRFGSRTRLWLDYL